MFSATCDVFYSSAVPVRSRLSRRDLQFATTYKRHLRNRAGLPGDVGEFTLAGRVLNGQACDAYLLQVEFGFCQSERDAINAPRLHDGKGTVSTVMMDVPRGPHRVRLRFPDHLQQGSPVRLEQLGNMLLVDLRNDDLPNFCLHVRENPHTLHLLCLELVIFGRRNVVHGARFVAVD